MGEEHKAHFLYIKKPVLRKAIGSQVYGPKTTTTTYPYDDDDDDEMVMLPKVRLDLKGILSVTNLHHAVDIAGVAEVDEARQSGPVQRLQRAARLLKGVPFPCALVQLQF